MSGQNGRRGAVEKAAEKRVKAFELRKRGKPYGAIAKAVGVSRGMAHRYVAETMAELKTLAMTDAEELRAMEIERLDGMLDGLWPAASKGDPQSVTAALRIGERRAKLLGLDAPTKLAGHDGGALKTFVEFAREVMSGAEPASGAS